MSERNFPATQPQLRREVGVVGATMMGLGSIVGTGIFVSLGLAAEAAGPAMLLALAVAALVATCNGLSSAQLAALHPVSGGTYEYGYRWLHPSLGFLAGWTFVWAKSASAATAALGFAGYGFRLFQLAAGPWQGVTALCFVAIAVGATLGGVRRSNVLNIALVLVSLVSLLSFLGAGLLKLRSNGIENFTPFFAPIEPNLDPLQGFLEACALMFVAYTGYGRIATLGEEIRDPQRSIPRAIVVTLVLAAGLYVGVGAVAIGTFGAEKLALATRQQAAPLESAARQLGAPAVATLIAVGATTAMGSVLLNLILGLSRVVLAMGRRGDIPRVFARLDPGATTPAPAVMLVGFIVAGLIGLGDVKLTWSFSAFSVLIYYAITNLAALKLSATERRYHPLIPALGLLSCLFLACWVQPRVWLAGFALLAVGLVWWSVARSLNRRRSMNS